MRAQLRVDLIAFGRPFITNPDLVERLRTGTPTSPSDRQVALVWRRCGGLQRIIRPRQSRRRSTLGPPPPPPSHSRQREMLTAVRLAYGNAAIRARRNLKEPVCVQPLKQPDVGGLA